MFDEVGVIDIYEDSKILSCIEETMIFIEDGSIEEPKEDPFPLSQTASKLKPLASTLKYIFLDHQHVKPMMISS